LKLNWLSKIIKKINKLKESHHLSKERQAALQKPKQEKELEYTYIYDLCSKELQIINNYIDINQAEQFQLDPLILPIDNYMSKVESCLETIRKEQREITDLKILRQTELESLYVSLQGIEFKHGSLDEEIKKLEKLKVSKSAIFEIELNNIRNEISKLRKIEDNNLQNTIEVPRAKLIEQAKRECEDLETELNNRSTQELVLFVALLDKINAWKNNNIEQYHNLLREAKTHNDLV